MTTPQHAPTMPPQARAQFHLLAKPTGAICNLDCKYCFFLSKEMLYPGSRFRMADELLEISASSSVAARSKSSSAGRAASRR